MEPLRVFFDDRNLSPAAQSGIILGAALLAAWLAQVILTRIIGRWAARTRSDLDDRIIGHLNRPIFVSVLLIGATWACEPLPMPPRLYETLVSVFRTLAVVAWMGAIFPITDLLFGSQAARTGRWRLDPATLPLFNNLIKTAAVGVAIYMVIVAWRINAAAWLASAGIVGIAVGFAAKDTLANFLAGVFILADRPYKVGDYVNLDSGERGEVAHIGLRSTRLLTRDDIEVTIPNAVMGNAKIVNESTGRWIRSRIRVQVGVAYGTDIDHAKRVLQEVGEQSDLVCGDPVPRVRFRTFGASGLDLELLCWIDRPERRGLVLDALNTEVYKRLNEEGIEIPFPKRDVYIRQAAPAPED